MTSNCEIVQNNIRTRIKELVNSAGVTFGIFDIEKNVILFAKQAYGIKLKSFLASGRKLKDVLTFELCLEEMYKMFGENSIVHIYDFKKTVADMEKLQMPQISDDICKSTKVRKEYIAYGIYFGEEFDASLWLEIVAAGIEVQDKKKNYSIQEMIDENILAKHTSFSVKMNQDWQIYNNETTKSINVSTEEHMSSLIMSYIPHPKIRLEYTNENGMCLFVKECEINKKEDVLTKKKNKNNTETNEEIEKLIKKQLPNKINFILKSDDTNHLQTIAKGLDNEFPLSIFTRRVAAARDQGGALDPVVV
jgi:hypothetical protein